jgi:hypothetical protein
MQKNHWKPGLSNETLGYYRKLLPHVHATEDTESRKRRTVSYTKKLLRISLCKLLLHLIHYHLIWRSLSWSRQWRRRKRVHGLEATPAVSLCLRSFPAGSVLGHELRNYQQEFVTALGRARKSPTSSKG